MQFQTETEDIIQSAMFQNIIPKPFIKKGNCLIFILDCIIDMLFCLYLFIFLHCNYCYFVIFLY